MALSASWYQPPYFFPVVSDEGLPWGKKKRYVKTLLLLPRQDDVGTLKIPFEEENGRGILSVPPQEMEESIYTECCLESVGVVGIYVHLRLEGGGGRGTGFQGSGPQGVRRSVSTRA